MGEGSVGAISLDLVINNDIAEQLAGVQNEAKKSSQKIGESIESTLNRPLESMAESLQNRVNFAVEEMQGFLKNARISSDPTERLVNGLENTVEKMRSVNEQMEKIQHEGGSSEKYNQLESQLISLSNTADKYKQKMEAVGSETASAVNAQIQETFNKLKDFQIPTTPVERLRAELENTRAKSDLLKTEWEQLANSEPSEKVTAKMLRLQQQIIATNKAAERFESDLHKAVGSETVSTINAQFQEVFNRLQNFRIPTTPAENLQLELENTVQK